MSPFRLWIYRILTWWLPETRCFGVKKSLLRWAGAAIGRDVRINSSAVFSGNGRLLIGDDVWVGPGVFISPVADAVVEIGSCVDIAPHAMIFTGSHSIDPEGRHMAGAGCASSVKIGDGCWIGAGAKVLPGVTLAEKTIVASGAVVTKSSDASLVLLAGVPATVRKRY